MLTSVRRHLPMFLSASLPKPIFFGFFIFTLFFGVLFSYPIHAQTLPALPGQTSGTGTYFSVTNSLYRNIAFNSSQSITASIQSIPKTIIITVMAAPAAISNSSSFTISGLFPLTTYYQYRDNYHNLSTETTDDTGSYTFTQDISSPHIFFIQTAKSTLFIRNDSTGGDCTQFGSWSPSTETCAFTRDATGTVEIDSSNITLDGNGHVLSGTGRVNEGIYVPSVGNITVKNLSIQQFAVGIYLFQSSSSTITGNTLSNISDGITLQSSSGNSVTNNAIRHSSDEGVLSFSSPGDAKNNTIASTTITDMDNGGAISVGFLSVGDASGNIVENNTIDGGSISNVLAGFAGISFSSGANGKVLNNTVRNVMQGIILAKSSAGTLVENNTVSVVQAPNPQPNITFDLILEDFPSGFTVANNNFFAATTSQQVESADGSNNIFNLPLPIGGNFWSAYSMPAQGCFDTNNDGICDAPFTFTDVHTGQVFADNLPWTREDGWKAPPKMINPTVDGEVTCQFHCYFNPKLNSYHEGIDIAMNGIVLGSPVVAAAGGIVERIQPDLHTGAGNWVWIAHGKITDLNGMVAEKISTRYLHLNTVNPLLTLGAIVTQGTLIGTVGRSGLDATSVPHLHFEVRQGDVPAPSPFADYTITTAIDPQGLISIGPSKFKFVDYPTVVRKIFFYSWGEPPSIVVKDPDGLIVSATLNQLPGIATYLTSHYVGPEEGINGYDEIIMNQFKTGDYAITVVPSSGEAPTDRFTLQVASGSAMITLAQNIAVTNIPLQPYIVRFSALGLEEIIPVQLKIEPQTINLSRRGVFTAFIQASRGFGFTVLDINTSTLMIGGAKAIQASIIKNESGKNSKNNKGQGNAATLISKFRTQDLVGVLPGNKVKLTLTGRLFNGILLEGSDTVKIIKNAEENKNDSRGVNINNPTITSTSLLANILSSFSGFLNALTSKF